ncbi:cytosine deaminase [Salinimicrobium marinum]|uniref:Cytosine deaminase n=1 Tax=Salinimicrobium marinum TaxID=680283 RepID=A0A918SAF9_9FLAO|nr:amidohydrolase family protein [Salinimicrobium marinum]GHA31083.1 cytosine deaminase [Salinimicrobium marinum]
MDLKRRNFIKKSGIFTAAGFLPGSFSALAAALDTSSEVQNNNAFIIRDANIITVDDVLGNFENASVLVKNGKIAEIGENISVPEGIEVINGKGFIVMPGLIDCHWHMWTSLLRSMAGDSEQQGYFPMTTRYSRLYSEKDMKIATKYAAAEALQSGITTVCDYNHNARSPAMVLAGCEALAEAGIRAQVLYGNYRDQEPSEPTHFDGIRQVMTKLQEDKKYHLLFLGLGSRGVGYNKLKSDWEKARELNLRISIHASSNEDQKGQIQKLESLGLLKSDVHIIHGNAITPQEIKAVKRSGASITMTPYSEMRIGYGLPKVNELHEAGVNTSLGVDTTGLSGNADMFAIMKLILNLSNAKAKNEFYLHPKEVLKMATINGARTLGIEDITGSLTPGKRADLIMLNRNDLNFSSGKRLEHLIVEAAQPKNVHFVCIDGKIIKRDGQLTRLDTDEIVNDAEDAFESMHRKINQ